MADLFLGGVCYEKLKSATIALIFPCHQHNAREMWAKYRLAQARPLKKGGFFKTFWWCKAYRIGVPSLLNTRRYEKISFSHYYPQFGGNMGTERSKILQGSQFFWFGALFFSQNWTNFEKPLKNGCFSTFWANFERFLKDTQFWLQNSAPNQINWLPWRISLLLVPMLPPNSR